MTYDFVKPVASDNINWQDELGYLVVNTKYSDFGSLIARSNFTKTTLLKTSEVAKFKVSSINFRAPHFTKNKIELLLHNVDFLKMDQPELELRGK